MGSTGGFSDEEDEGEYEITNSNNKDWLKPAVKSLSKLDEVKPSVYNFGLTDARTLKPTSIRERKILGDTENASSTLNKLAWGSSGSIPDLLKQHNAKNRPESAKVHRPGRPSSGKRPRPQSAKPDSFTPHPPNQPSISILGSKFDPSSRPPKSTPQQNVSTGWVCKTQENNTKISRKPQGPAPPPSPSAWIGSPDLTGENRDIYAEDSVDCEQLRNCPSPILHRPTPEPIHFSLPDAGTELDDDDLDTERLLQKATDADIAMDGKQLERENEHVQEESSGIGHLDLEVPCAQGQQDNWPDLEESDTVIGRLDASDLSVSDDEIGAIFSDSSDDGADSHHYTAIKSHGTQLTSHQSTKDIPNKHGRKSCVKFMENRNITVDITPRNIGRKVEELSMSRRKQKNDFNGASSGIRPSEFSTSNCDNDPHWSSSSHQFSDDLKQNPREATSDLGLSNTHDKLIVREFSSREQGESLTETKQNRQDATTANRNSPFENRSITPVAMVTVDFGDDSDREKRVTSKGKKTRQQGHSVETMMSMLSFIDNSEKHGRVQRDAGLCEEDRDVALTSDLQPLITVCSSGPQVNYYEQARVGNPAIDNGTSATENNSGVNPLIMTTKTLQFDRVEPSETIVKSIIKSQPCPQREFTYSPRNSEAGERNNSGMPKRPSSAKVTKKPPSVPGLNLSSIVDEGRPGSRLGFVDMGADGGAAGDRGTFLMDSHVQTENKTQPAKHTLLRRPRSKSASVKPKVLTQTETFQWAEINTGQPSRVIDPPRISSSQAMCGSDKPNLEKDDDTTVGTKVSDLYTESDIIISTPDQQPKTLLSPLLKVAEKNDFEIKPRPVSSPAVRTTTKPPRSGGISKQRAVASKLLKENALSSTAFNRHYSSYSRSASAPVRRKSAPAAQTKPPIYIVTKKFDPNEVEYDSPEIQECRKLQERLAEKGVDVNLNTLKRALLPPDGTTYYYDTTADLPRSNSYGLLSHPKVWLPEEYQRLQQAKRKLARADELLRLQRLEEERETRQSETPAKKKKKRGKKGKKGKKKIKRSNSVA